MKILKRIAGGLLTIPLLTALVVSVIYTWEAWVAIGVSIALVGTFFVGLSLINQSLEEKHESSN